MADWIFNGYLVKNSAILEFDSYRVGNRALFRVVIIRGVARIFYANNLFAQSIDTWIGRNIFFVITSC
jgi:hypothetical protein